MTNDNDWVKGAVVAAVAAVPILTAVLRTVKDMDAVVTLGILVVVAATVLALGIIQAADRAAARTGRAPPLAPGVVEVTLRGEGSTRFVVLHVQRTTNDVEYIVAERGHRPRRVSDEDVEAVY